MGSVQELNKYILLDRDGTLIKFIPYLTRIDDVELFPDSIEALKVLKKSGYQFGVITNQPVIGMGLATAGEVNLINKRISETLFASGIILNFFYVCPHSSKDSCLCRKPKTELGLKAIKKFQIDVSSSYYIGDSEKDVEFGQALGLKVLKLSIDSEYSSNMKISVPNLRAAANRILAEN